MSPTGCGVVFKLDATGKETVLYRFTGRADGAFPVASLLRDAAGNLYGTAIAGGVPCGISGDGCGVVFKLDTAGKETVLYAFRGGTDGAFPSSNLLRDRYGNLYGNASQGGVAGGCGGDGCGVVFRVDSGGRETVLHTFTGRADGGEPSGGLIADSSQNLYGMTSLGGSSQPEPCALGCGVVFKLAKTGTETVLHSFAGNADGEAPVAGLLRDSSGNLYGTTEYGGLPGWGVVFEVAADGQETVLYTFTGGPDGATPRSTLLRDTTGNLYGTTVQGGIGCEYSCGVIFELTSKGREIVLHSFIGVDGNNPYAGLLADGSGNAYGTTLYGGKSGNGVVFKITH